jgi:PAS domain S-box-containing protein
MDFKGMPMKATCVRELRQVVYGLNERLAHVQDENERLRIRLKAVESGDDLPDVNSSRTTLVDKAGSPQLEKTQPQRSAMEGSSKDVLPDSIMMLLDRDAKIRFISPTRPGWTLDRVIGTSAYDYAGAEDRKRMADCFTRVLDSGEPDRFEVKYQRVDGQTRCLESRVDPVIRNGTVTEMVMVTNDVTEYWRSKKRLAELERQMHERTQQLKLLRKEVLDATVREQQRIGQFLHDGVGQELVGARLLANMLVNALSERSVREAKIATKIADAIGQALESVRRAAKGLLPTRVDARGLITALQSLASVASDVSGIQCSIECPPSVPIHDDQMATQIYYIAREAVTNAVKHSEAKRILIRLSADNEFVRLEIIDDGMGIQTAELLAEGCGLQIMQYRAERIGANLQFEPTTDGGTTVICTLPRGAPRDIRQDSDSDQIIQSHDRRRPSARC